MELHKYLLTIYFKDKTNGEWFVTFLFLGDQLQIKIMDDGSAIAGRMYSVVCEVEVVSGSPTASWVHNGSEVTADGLTGIGTATITITLTFNPLGYEHRGEYTCVGFSNISNPNTTSSTFTIHVQGKCGLLLFC